MQRMQALPQRRSGAAFCSDHADRRFRIPDGDGRLTNPGGSGHPRSQAGAHPTPVCRSRFFVRNLILAARQARNR